jgi:hypothetical protein
MAVNRKRKNDNITRALSNIWLVWRGKQGGWGFDPSANHGFLNACCVKPELRSGKGARPPRAQLSAPSRKTRAHGNVPKVRAGTVRKRLSARARPANARGGRAPRPRNPGKVFPGRPGGRGADVEISRTLRVRLISGCASGTNARNRPAMNSG